MGKLTLAIVGGLGSVGRNIPHELQNHFERVVIIDRGDLAEQQLAFFESVWRNPHHIYYAYADSAEGISSILKGYEVDVCIGAVPSFLQDKIAEAAAAYGQCHYFDLGASHECLNKQKELGETFKQNKKILMPFCGFDPGMLNILLLSCATHTDCDEIKAYVGCIAKEKPKNSFVHEWTFNPKSTLETYCGDVYAIQNGKLVLKKALDEYVETNINHRCYGAFFTNCGNEEVIKIIAAQMLHIKTCEIKTLRYVGHLRMVNFLLETGLLDAETFPMNTEQLARTIPFAERDVALLDIRLFKNGRRVGGIEWTEHGDQQTITAMQRVTAKSAALIITLALEYASRAPLSGFLMPETFTSNVLNIHPERMIEKMQNVGLSIKTSLP